MVALAFLLLLSTWFQTKAAAPVSPQSAWTLVWNDEFSGGNGSVPDRSKWVIETGGNGWGNHELEYYTNRVENVQVRDGNLVIIARKEAYSDNDGVMRSYTSARLKTAHKFSQAYGRFEAHSDTPRARNMASILDAGR